MFRNLAFVFLIISSVLTISAQEKSDREESGLLGYVKSVTEYTAEVNVENGNPVEKNRELISIKTFDIAGKKITSFFFTDEGKLLYGDTFIYGATGKLVEKSTERSRFVYLCDKYFYVYDEVGRLSEETCYVNGRGAMGKYVSRYDDKGRLSEKERIPLIEDNLYFKGNTLTKYKYNGKGELAEIVPFTKENGEWKPDKQTSSEFASIYFSNEKTQSSTELKYDRDGKLKFVVTSIDDEKGNEIEAVTYFADGTIKEGTRYGYQYDKQGNIIKQIVSEWITEDGKSFFQTSEISYRKIEYFKKAEIAKFEAKKPK